MAIEIPRHYVREFLPNFHSSLLIYFHGYILHIFMYDRNDKRLQRFVRVEFFLFHEASIFSPRREIVRELEKRACLAQDVCPQLCSLHDILSVLFFFITSFLFFYFIFTSIKVTRIRRILLPTERQARVYDFASG